MSYGEAMRAARKRCGFSQRMLERKSGVHINAIQHYENCRVMPGLYNLIAITDALGISIDEYIGRRTPWQTSNSNALNAHIGGVSQPQENHPESVATTICTPESEE